MNKPKPTKHSLPVLQQVCKLILAGLVKKLAERHGVQAKCQTFSPWNHLVSVLHAQLCHSIGLNDACDGLVHHKAKVAPPLTGRPRRTVLGFPTPTSTGIAT